MLILKGQQKKVLSPPSLFQTIKNSGDLFLIKILLLSSVYFYNLFLGSNLSKGDGNLQVPAPGYLLRGLARSIFQPFPKVVQVNFLFSMRVYLGTQRLQGGALDLKWSGILGQIENLFFDYPGSQETLYCPGGGIYLASSSLTRSVSGI